jgi:ADP-ribose pyrophosphatase YjhB (NUDIX family)
VCRSDQEGRFLPEGTREPGETLTDLARRELLEEAGATLRGDLRYFAAHIPDRARDAPFQPNLPHPRTYWAYVAAEVAVMGPPTNPSEGELIVEVVAQPPQQAADYLANHDALHADVLRLADAWESSGPRTKSLLEDLPAHPSGRAWETLAHPRAHQCDGLQEPSATTYLQTRRCRAPTGDTRTHQVFAFSPCLGTFPTALHVSLISRSGAIPCKMSRSRHWSGTSIFEPCICARSRAWRSLPPREWGSNSSSSIPTCR